MLDNTAKSPIPSEQNSTVPTPLNNNIPSQSPIFSPHAGLILGDTYRLEKMLGKGGMGEVWLASHLLLGEFRAIKLLLSNLASNNEDRQRFIFSEAKNALRLQHPNIVRVHDIGQSRGLLYIVMEYVLGSNLGFDLKTYLKNRGKLSLSETNAFLQQLAPALALAHNHNLVHRDIKPANILVTSENTLKLTDFGIVKDLANPVDITLDGYGPGTPIYMAPEQARGQAVPASDQYALGIMLYEWLTGITPFRGQVSELLAQHATAIPRPPSEIDSNIPVRISQVILRALAKQPEKRFSSVLELANEFQNALSPNAQDVTSYSAQDTFANTVALPAPSPIIETMEPQPLTPNNLPKILTKFIGRKTEIGEIVEIVQHSSGRLVTLTGVGGTGKTRLSLQVAEQLLPQFKDGVYFVTLENITERATFINELAVVLSLKDQPNQALLDVLKDWLADKELLLLLDNFEQLIAKGATLVAELLKAAPKLKILVTSRELLHLMEEREYSVATLALPTKKIDAETNLESLSGYAAVALFTDRAMTVKSDFKLTNENIAVVVEICQKLDGLPLALELAAARIRVISLQKMLERLNLKLLTGGSRDLPARQQTLRAAISWSYDLLEPQEQLLFARLSIFVAGCTLEAAEAICNPLEIEPLDGIDSLIQKNLLRQWEGTDGERHYGMLQTIREFSLEKLAEFGELEAQNKRYGNYYKELTLELESKISAGPAQFQSLKILDSDYENVREILYQSIETKNLEPQIGLAIAVALWDYWRIRGYYSEGWHYVEQAVGLAHHYEQQAQAGVFLVAGLLNLKMGRHSDALKYFEESLSHYQQFGDKSGIAKCLINLGNLANSYGDYAKAVERFENALANYKEVGNKLGCANSLNNLGNAAYHQGDYAKAVTYYEEALIFYREIADKDGIATILFNLSAITRGQGELIGPLQYAKEALTFFQELGDKENASLCLINLGNNTTWQGDFAAAAKYLQDAFKLAQEIGSLQLMGYCQNYLGVLATWQGDFTNASSYLREAETLYAKIDEKEAIIDWLVNLGFLALNQGDLEKALRLYQESLFLADEVGNKPYVVINLNSLGIVALCQKNFTAAYKYFEEALSLSEAENYGEEKTIALNGLAASVAEQGQRQIAIKYLEQSLEISRKTQNNKLIAESFCTLLRLKLEALSQKELENAVEGLIDITKMVLTQSC